MQKPATHKRKQLADRRRWSRQVKHFESVRLRLSRNPKYNEKYVAFVNSEIVDVDEDKFALFDRVSKAHEEGHFLIVKVERNPYVYEAPGIGPR